MSDWGYTREVSTRTNKTGIQRCVITGAEERISKSSGKPMVVVTVMPSGSRAKVNNYIVKNDRFNQNMTSFFDAFPTIADGNFNFLEWIGAEGAANFVEDENGYIKVKWFVDPERAKDLPPFEGEKPEQQTVTTLDGESYAVVDNDGDLPF